MRDWNVRKPSAEAAPIDWSLPEPEPLPRPDHHETPWGETYHRCTDGYYRVRTSDPPLAYSALLDKIERYHLRWYVPRIGVGLHVHGDRVAVLWRNRDGTYRAGHVAAAGPLDGKWLVESAPFRRAATRAELWWLGLGPMRHARVDLDALARRLGVK
jgi:hypothetical protein